ncbi:MAG: hypothetical protein ACE5HO_21825, partial [bacterium]
LSAVTFLTTNSFAAQPSYLYKATLVRAAPGKLLDLIDLYKAQMPVYDARGDERPFWMRHSQGDQWDLLLLFPMGSYADYYRKERLTKRTANSPKSFQEKLQRWVAWQEDIFVFGPPLDEVKNAFDGTSFFHVEMFQALPGKHAELLQQRQMENVYLKNIDRPQNLIFVRDQGGPWDLFTVGFYRDLKHFAASADVPEAAEEQAAKTAGFEAANRIGTYLRTLIMKHHDTLAVRIK